MRPVLGHLFHGLLVWPLVWGNSMCAYSIGAPIGDGHICREKHYHSLKSDLNDPYLFFRQSGIEIHKTAKSGSEMNQIIRWQQPLGGVKQQPPSSLSEPAKVFEDKLHVGGEFLKSNVYMYWIKNFWLWQEFRKYYLLRLPHRNAAFCMKKKHVSPNISVIRSSFKNCIRVKLSVPRRWLPAQRMPGLGGKGVCNSCR